MTLSIRARLTFWYVTVLSLVLVVAAVAVHNAYARSRLLRIDEELGRLGTQVARIVGADIEEGLSLPEAANDALEDFGTTGRSLAIFDASGLLLSGRWEGLPRPAGNPLVARDPAETTVDGAFRTSLKRHQHAQTSYQVGVAESLAPLQVELRGLTQALVGSVFLALVLASAGGWWIAHAALRPLSSMADQARRIDERTPGFRLAASNPKDELGLLAGAFNELLGRLESLLREQRQFMADASHELRTPVSVARTAIEVTLARERRPEEEYRDGLAVVRDQMRRLTRLVEDMFTLARADVAGLPLDLAPLYLDELVADCVKEASLLAEPKGIALERQGASDVEVTGDERRLRQMLLNLLDNAIRHTPGGGRVRVELVADPETALLTVTDTGAGIPASERERVFLRFVRLDASRHGDGAGLGLPIARAIAEAHGGTLVLASGDGSGSTFLARLPRRMAPPN